ncbi:four helix bundle protein [Lewinella sp. 4G2]|uniref:four helix bundle protein n=1 Tax=Lewinella sp. 4G2 TaxID=1803372 RepID=UPI0007B4C2EC|nr:four helix bundle protein [Lewinella sp. 4G2]OAV45302.1 four helix bundle protein [Lewinella sp. 4G2]
MAIRGFTKLLAYSKGEDLAVMIQDLSQAFPKEEQYSLTDQVRRSSRSVCANLAEAYGKRRYPKHFISKVTDSLGEANETVTWLRFARRFNYIDNQQYLAAEVLIEEILRLLQAMIKAPEKFCKYRE